MSHDLHITGDASADALLSTDPLALLIGMLLGAMVATPTGRSIGNQIGDAALAEIKKAMPKPTAEQKKK